MPPTVFARHWNCLVDFCLRRAAVQSLNTEYVTISSRVLLWSGIEIESKITDWAECCWEAEEADRRRKKFGAQVIKQETTIYEMI